MKAVYLRQSSCNSIWKKPDIRSATAKRVGLLTNPHEHIAHIWYLPTFIANDIVQAPIINGEMPTTCWLSDEMDLNHAVALDG